MKKAELLETANQLIRTGREAIQAAIRASGLQETAASKALSAIIAGLDVMANDLDKRGSVDAKYLMEIERHTTNFILGLGSYIKLDGEGHQQLFGEALEYGNNLKRCLSGFKNFALNDPAKTRNKPPRNKPQGREFD